jgi:hypothetical protein
MRNPSSQTAPVDVMRKIGSEEESQREWGQRMSEMRVLQALTTLTS